MKKSTLFCLLACAVIACKDIPKTSKTIDNEPLILIQDSVSGQSGYQSKSNPTAIPLGKYAQCLTDTFRTHAIVLTQGTPRWVVIDRTEKELYEVFPFDNGPDYPSEGLFRILQNGKIGYADANTYAIVIPPHFDCAYPFENGKAKVSNDCLTSLEGEH